MGKQYYKNIYIISLIEGEKESKQERKLQSVVLVQQPLLDDYIYNAYILLNSN